MRFVLLGLLCAGSRSSSNAMTSGPVGGLRAQHALGGLLYLFISLWILSIFGDYGDMTSWYQARHMELFHWSLLSERRPVPPLRLGVKGRRRHAAGAAGLVFWAWNLYTLL